MKVLATFFFLCSLSAWASCPGMEGEQARRCECYERVSPPGPSELTCQKKADCLALEDGCGGWMVINKNFLKAAKNRRPKVTPALKQTPAIAFDCDSKIGQCVQRY